MHTRRRFIALLPLAGLARAAEAAAVPAVDPRDPVAQAQGYVADAAHADKARFPKYAAGQTCANCALYQGAKDAASGPCSIYQNRLVAAAGWCNVWVKRA